MLDIRVTKVVNTNTLYAGFLAAALHLSIEVIFCNWKQSIVQTDVILHSKIFLNFLHKETRHCDGAKEDRRNRIKDSTWESKDHIIRTKLLPYFGRLKMSSITPQQIIRWQNELINYRDKNGKPYSPVYLKTIQNQLSAIFNHAVRYYNLKENPCVKAGSMGKKKSREMLFWTKDEYLKFIDAMMDKPLSFYAFEMLYWCGIREGELLALTPADFDFQKRTVTISKSYQRISGRDVITTPKTEKSNRTFDKVLKSHVKVSAQFVKLFPFPSLRLSFRLKASLLGLLALSGPVCVAVDTLHVLFFDSL